MYILHGPCAWCCPLDGDVVGTIALTYIKPTLNDTPYRVDKLSGVMHMAPRLLIICGKITNSVTNFKHFRHVWEHVVDIWSVCKRSLRCSVALLTAGGAPCTGGRAPGADQATGTQRPESEQEGKARTATVDDTRHAVRGRDLGVGRAWCGQGFESGRGLGVGGAWRVGLVGEWSVLGSGQHLGVGGALEWVSLTAVWQCFCGGRVRRGRGLPIQSQKVKFWGEWGLGRVWSVYGRG